MYPFGDRYLQDRLGQDAFSRFRDMEGSMDFRVTRLPALVTGAGSIARIASLASAAGARRLFIFTGGNSFLSGARRAAFEKSLAEAGIDFTYAAVSGEPTPELVDAAAAEARDFQAGAVCGIGGGSALDAAKAVAAMFFEAGSVEEYLEDVGTRPPSGRRLPLFEAPTTAGTGSEATKNAVISRGGPDGFKKSFRHEAYVCDAAILDPELSLTCPPAQTAYSGLDAVTQLLEAYVSVNASPFTDALALQGLRFAGRFLERAFRFGGTDLEARAGMAYAAYLSGVALANAGLGAVHGMAAALGGLTRAPHGALSGTLLAVTTRGVAKTLSDGTEGGRIAIEKYARAGFALAGNDGGAEGDFGGTNDQIEIPSFDTVQGRIGAGLELLFEIFDRWTADFAVPRLSALGVDPGILAAAAAISGNKNAPVILSADSLERIMRERL
jgi:alcohol dehydrogenase